MPSHESRLVIRREPDVAPSHPPRVVLSAVLTFTTKKWSHLNPPLYIYRGKFKCEPLFGCEREDNRERDTWRLVIRHVGFE